MPKEEAIQEDVSTEKKTHTNNPRLEIINRMGDKRREEFGIEKAEGITSEEDDLGEGEQEEELKLEGEEQIEKEEKEDIKQEEEQHAAPVYEKDGKWYLKRKVNGKEEEVEFEKVLASHQKDVAADARLEEASRRRKELDQKEAEIRAQAEEIKRQQQEIAEKQNAAKKSVLPELLSEYQDALTEFDKEDQESVVRLQQAQEKLNEAYREPQQQVSQPSINEDEIVNKALVKMKSSQWSQNLEKANQWLYSDQKDIDVEDDALRDIASKEAERIMEERVMEGQKIDPSFSPYDVDPIEVYKAAVSKTKEWLDAKTGNATDQARISRKRSATGSSVTGSNARAPIKDNTPKVKTQAERIKEMREARGLPPL